MYSDEIASRAKFAIMDAMKYDPNFKEQFIELLNKKDDSDKDIEIDIGLPPVEVDDNKMRYIIHTSKKRTEFSSIPVGSISLSRNLLEDLYKQLGEVLKK